MTAHPIDKRQMPHFPHELDGPVPRDVRLTGGGIAAAVTALMFVLAAVAVAILMSVANVRAGAQQRLREQQGVATDAEVVQVTVQRGEHPRRVVTYRYEVDGQSYTRQVRLRERDQRPIARGGRIPIGFLRSDPETSWIPGYGPSGSIPPEVILVAVLSLLAIAAVIAWSVRRQWTLLSEGRVARARVTEVKKVRSDKHKTTYRTIYEFETISGAKKTSRCDISKAPPAVGAMIPIVYHRDKPEWSAAYPLQLVKPGRLVN